MWTSDTRTQQHQAPGTPEKAWPSLPDISSHPLRKTGRCSVSNRRALSHRFSVFHLGPKITCVKPVCNECVDCRTWALQLIMSALRQCRRPTDNKPHVVLLHQPIRQHFQIWFGYCDSEIINYYEDGHLDHAPPQNRLVTLLHPAFCKWFFLYYCWIQLGRFSVGATIEADREGGVG